LYQAAREFKVALPKKEEISHESLGEEGDGEASGGGVEE